MSKKTEETKIGQFRIIAEQLPALEALALMPVLGRILSASASKLGNVTTLDPKNLDTKELAGAFTELFLQLEASDFQALTFKLLKGIIVIDTKAEEKHELLTPGDIDEAFTGELDVILRVMAWSVKFNFASFFKGDLLQKVAAMGHKLQATQQEKASS